MHCGATARVSSIWKHLLIISILILGKWLILQQLQDNQAGGWNQSVGSSTLNLIASNKPRATGTVLILWRSPLPSVPRSQLIWWLPLPSSPANDVQWATGIGLLCWWSTVHPASTNDGQPAAEIISLYFGDEQLSHSRRAMPFNPRDHRYSQSQSMMMTSRQNGAVVSFVNGLTDGTVTGPVKPLFQEITKDVYRTEAKIVDMVTQAYAKFLNHINFCSLKNHYHARVSLRLDEALPRSLDLPTEFSVGICTTIPLVKN